MADAQDDNAAAAAAAAKVYKGACICGKTTIEAAGPVLFRCLCHCQICQRYIGATSAAFVGFAGKQLQVKPGPDGLLPFKSSEGMTRYRCGSCGTPVYAESTDPKYDFRDAPLVVFERDADGKIKDLDELRPTAHIFCASRVSSIAAADPAGVTKFLGHFGQSETTDECP